MDKVIEQAWNYYRSDILEKIRRIHHRSFTYELLLRIAIDVMFGNLEDENYGYLWEKSIKALDYGTYNGTLIFILVRYKHQPSLRDHWYTYVNYGSTPEDCGSTPEDDALEAIRGPDDYYPTSEEANAYLSLTLLMIQRLKRFE
jgi:hypothetical protein